MELNKTEHIIQGLNIDGEWHALDKPVPEEADPLVARDHVVGVLRTRGITRYSQVRVAKVVTTIEQHGGQVGV